MHFATKVFFKGFQGFLINSCYVYLPILVRTKWLILILLQFGRIFIILCHQRLIELNVFSEILKGFFELLDFSIQNIVFSLVLARLIFHALTHLTDAIFHFAQIWVYVHLVLYDEIFKFPLRIFHVLFKALNFTG